MIAYEEKTVRELRSELENAVSEIDNLVDAKLAWNGGSAKEIQKRLKDALDLLNDEVEVPDGT